MPDVTTLDSLLETCIKDLHSAERQSVERSAPIVAAVGDGELSTCLEANVEQSRRQAERLERAAMAIGADADGPECIWTTGVFDDADHDVETIAAGPLLDIALIGAIRKGKQAEVVSYETAIHIARALGQSEAVALLEETHREEKQTDAVLHALLTKFLTAAVQAQS